MRFRFVRAFFAFLITAFALGGGAVSAFAATVTSANIFLSTQQAGQAANYTFVFTTPSGADEGDTIQLIFNDSFGSAPGPITGDDVDVSVGGSPLITATSTCGGLEQVGIFITPNVLTVEICVGNGGAIAPGSEVAIRIGTHAVDFGTGLNQLINPSTPGNYYVALDGTFGDSGTYILTIGGDDGVSVSATVTGNEPPPVGCPPNCGGGGPPPEPPPPDTTPPIISNVVVSNVTATSAQLSFTTSQPARSDIQYGTSTAYGQTYAETGFTESHSVPLVGLLEGTTYHVHITATNFNGYSGVSGDFTFTTLDETPPVLSEIVVTDITETSARVTWTTNEPATSAVDFDTSDAYGQTVSSGALVTAHDVLLTGLTHSTLYHFRVRSSDAASNETVSADGTFNTTANLPPGNVANLAAVAGNQRVSLAWTNPPDADLEAVRVVACTGGPPSGPLDTEGCAVVFDALGEAFEHEGLTNGTAYHYGVFARDAADQYASGALAQATPMGPDLPPGSVTGLSIAPGNQQLTLSWTNPLDEDLAAIRVVVCTAGFPPDPVNAPGCSVAFTGLDTSFAHSGLVNDQTYYYGVYAMDVAGQFSGGAFGSGTPREFIVDEPPPPVSAFTAASGDGEVRLSWINPTDEDLEAVRLISCTGRFPGSPADVGGPCVLLFDGFGTAYIHAGLTNGQTYYYGIYARDAASQYSTGAFRSAVPSALAPVCGDNMCNGDETAFSCPLDCGAPPIMCGNNICELGETAQSCPADCGFIPTCGNAMCEEGETALTCPSDCAAELPPPTTVEPDHRVDLSDTRMSVAERTVLQPPFDGGFDLLTGTPGVFEIPASVLAGPLERAQLVIGQQTYVLAPRTAADGTVTYQASIPFPAVPGLIASSLRLFYEDGTTQTVPFVSRVRGFGQVHEIWEGERLPVAGATVTLLVGTSGNTAWDAARFGQENPRLTGSSGTFAWYVPSGTYRIRAEKEGYRTETVRVDAANHIAAADIRLRREQPFIPTVIEAIQDIGTAVEEIRQSPAAQESAVIAAPVVATVAVASTASLVAGFGLVQYLQFITTAPVLFFARRRRKGFGVVYNAYTKMPVDLAIVRLYRMDETKPDAPGRLVASRVTDKGGRYFFLAQPGLYRLTATKPGFSFPSAYLAGKKDDGLFLDVYHAEPIRVTEASATIAANLPMDPVAGGAEPRQIIWKRRFRRAQSAAAFLGNIVAVGVLIVRPSMFTAALAVGQLIVYALVRRLAAPKKPKSWGIVYDSATGRPLSQVIARVLEPTYNKVLETTVTDTRGRFTFLLGPNEYYAVFQKPGFEQAELRPIDFTKNAEPKEVSAKIQVKRAP